MQWRRSRTKLALLFFCLTVTTPAFCQADSIYLHSGMVIGGHVQETLRFTITYTTHEAKGLTKALSKRAIRKIIYGSGSSEEISPPMSINTADDWEKVVVLNDQSEAIGLQYAGEVTGLGGGKFVDSGTAEQQSLMLLRKAAARLRCPFVYIADNHVRHTGFVGRRVRKSGVAYKY